MRDDTYGLPPLPLSMAALTVDGANAIEENLRYLISLFALFDARIKAEAIGSLGYLELEETGSAGDGFAVEFASQINMLTVIVEGEDLSALSWSGDGWTAESRSPVQLCLVCRTPDFWDADGVHGALSALLFGASADLDAEISLTASCEGLMSTDALGPVALRFRSGATWALVEDQNWTWGGVEEAGFDWAGLAALRKNE